MEREGSLSALFRGVASDGAVLAPRALKMAGTQNGSGTEPHIPAHGLQKNPKMVDRAVVECRKSTL